MNSRFELASKEKDFFFPTYEDIKNANSSKIFEAEDLRGASKEQISEAEKVYEEIVKKLEAGEEIDEGILGGLAGGAVGALAGPAIGKAICKVLGVDPKGNLGRLLTSRLVTTALGFAIGKGK
jgi:outer membrane lipoprotein SlyB